MTVVPLPASPCMRCQLTWTNVDGTLASSRFYLSYSGSAPTAANLNTLATDIANAWNTDLAVVASVEWSLTEVDILDITTETGASGLAHVNFAGTVSGAQEPAQVAINVEYKIARRYRGGKPRIFLPPAGVSQTVDAAHWQPSFVTQVNTQVAAFFAAVEAFAVGSEGTLQHVNLSYYKGFTNVTNSSGRTRAAPKYRDQALLDTVTGYSCKSELGSQKRRRTATTP